MATGLEKVSFNSNPKGNVKECSNYRTIALISHASKVMLKILQAWLQQYVNREFPDVQAGFRKGRGTRDQIANIHWITEIAREFQKLLIRLYKSMLARDVAETLGTWQIVISHQLCRNRSLNLLTEKDLSKDGSRR